MIGLIGKTSLYLALIFALLQSLLPLIGWPRRNAYLLSFAKPAAILQFVCVMTAFGLLTDAFVANDFSIGYVAANSHANLPFMYRLTAVWGAHEGSILLWIVILNIWSMIFSFTQNEWRLSPLVLAVLGFISIGFLIFLMGTSDPFVSALGIRGHDLNPLLQDPGFVIHPPMLYMGYVGFSAAFAITLAALITNQLDQKWASVTHQFAVAAWGFLTLGITLGSWWAYRVLGWGGFWFWDPVENASLLPWLSGTALIHVLALCEKYHTAKKWAALLAIISFSLSLLGTFLVRSGVLISAHTFANDPARGVFLLLLFGLFVVVSLAIYIYRLNSFSIEPKTKFKLISRETGLWLNSVLLIVAMLSVLLGTVYPIVLDALHLGLISVGAPYFNKIMFHFVIIGMILMAIYVRAGKDQNFKTIFIESFKLILLSSLFAFGFLIVFSDVFQWQLFLLVSISIWVMLSAKPYFKVSTGMFFAHLGIVILVLGVILSSFLSQEKQARMKPGEMISLGPYQFLFLSEHVKFGPNYKSIQAAFEVSKNKKHIINLYPEKRLYTVRQMVMSKVAIHPGVFRDLYIALGEPLDHHYWSLRLYYKPFIRWIWLGGFLMMIGGFFSIIQHKKVY